jgi:hypothetical protein
VVVGAGAAVVVGAVVVDSGAVAGAVVVGLRDSGGATVEVFGTGVLDVGALEVEEAAVEIEGEERSAPGASPPLRGAAEPQADATTAKSAGSAARRINLISLCCRNLGASVANFATIPVLFGFQPARGALSRIEASVAGLQRSARGSIGICSR